MEPSPTPSPVRSSRFDRILTVGRFVFFTVLSVGAYPFYRAARKAPTLRRETLLLRAGRIQDPAGNPSSWPWLRSAWKAWACTLILVEGLTIFCAGFMSALVNGNGRNVLRGAKHLPPGITFLVMLSAAAILAPQGYIISELVMLIARTLRPERLETYLSTRWKASLDRSQRRWAGRGRAANTPAQEGHK